MTDNANPTAWRWLDAFDDPEAGAWNHLDAVAADLDRDHPIRRTVDFLDPVADPTHRRNASTPTLAHFAERAHTEPGAFSRCMLELARSRSLTADDAAGPRLLQCRRGLAQRPRCAALASAYQAEADLWIPGIDQRAGRLVFAAYRQVLGDAHESTVDPWTREILATLVEIEVDLLARRRHPLAVRHTLDQLLSLLDDCPIPGRRAAAGWRFGRYLVALDEDAEATRVLDAAERELPEDVDLAQRLEIWHLRAFAESALGHDDTARHYLDQAEPMVDHWGSPAIQAQRLHLLGHLAHRAGRRGEAEDCWVESVVLNRALGHATDAAQTARALERLRAE